MPSRLQSLSALTVVTQLPQNADSECPVCTDEYTSPVALPCKHIYCRKCICEWLSMRGRNTCPSCREILFDINEADRGPVGDERLRLAAQALANSGLTGDQYEIYNDELSFSISTVQQAAAAAHQYLAEEGHPTTTEDVLIDMKLLAPHIVAMANLIQGYARAAHRPHSGYQTRDWKLIVSKLIDHLLLANGQTRTGAEVTGMAREYRARIKESLLQELLDMQGRSNETRRALAEPAGGFAAGAYSHRLWHEVAWTVSVWWCLIQQKVS